MHRTVLEHLPVGVGACSKQREGRLAYLWSRSLRLRFEFRECERAAILVPVGYSNSNVPMVKPTQDWQGEHASYPLGIARDRCVLLQR